VAPESAIQVGPTGGVGAMVLKELAKAAGSQPIGPGETAGGEAHGDAGGAQASMAAGG